MAELDLVGDARSSTGHAAYSMRGTDDRWVLIQKNTFLNWMNEQLKESGHSISSLETDLCDGIRLCALMEVLQKKRIGRVIKKPINHHQYLENVTLALQAMVNDDIRLVNIGSEDIVNGNMKLILGMIWRLILRYQIGKASKVPPKKLMLSWLKAVIPEMGISNFHTDWNDGVALHALIEYCRPGTCPNWRQLSRYNGLENCRNGMELAKKHFDIPLVVTPENLANPDLDELSGMTYLSYYMKLDSPGYHATLKWAQNQIPQKNIKNFQQDWNDGTAVSALVHSLGGTVNQSSSDPVVVLYEGMEGGKRLGVEPVITAQEMSSSEVDHLGVMAYVAWFQHLSRRRQSGPPPAPAPISTPVVFSPPEPPAIPPSKQVILSQFMRESLPGNITTFTIDMVDRNARPEDIKVEVIGPTTKPPVSLSWHGTQCHGHFTPQEGGNHKVMVYNRGHLVDGCPQEVYVKGESKTPPQLIHLMSMFKDCNVGQTQVIRLGDLTSSNVKVEARSPSGRVQELTVSETNGTYTTNFTPSEVGDWLISILYDGQDIQGSPFNVRVYDAAQVKVFGLEGGAVGKQFSFSADTSGAGQGELAVDITHNGRNVPCAIHEDTGRRGVYRVTFTPDGPGIYTIRVYFAGMEITGSPYTLEIVDSSMVTATGEGLTTAEVNRRMAFTVNTHGATGGDVRVNITSPRGQSIPSNIFNQGDGTYRVEYTIQEAGEYLIDVAYYGRSINGSPFKVSAVDANRIIVSNLQSSGQVGRVVEFDIDAAHAGSGNLEIMVNEGTIPCSVQNRGNRQFHATFVPKEAVPHKIQMKFNGKEVPGSPWRVDVRSPIQVSASGQGLQMVSVRQMANTEIKTNDPYNSGVVTATVTSPTGRLVPNQIFNNYNGNYRMEYTVQEVGNHSVEIFYDGAPISGSPFISKAYDPAAIIIGNVPSGVVGKPVEFTIDVTQAGEGQLEIMVNRGSVPNTVKMLRKGVFLVSFVPREPRQHVIEIKFNGEMLPRCPINVPILDASRVTVQGDGIKQVAVNKHSSFRVNTAAAGEAELDVRVTDYSGKAIPTKVTGDPARGYEVGYMVPSVGTHKVDVAYAGQPVAGSPFSVKSFDPSKVKVHGVENSVVGKRSHFYVDVYNAGEGNMEISILTNSGRNLANHVRQLGPGKFEVSYTPIEGIPHEAHITFNGHHVSGSPFPFSVVDAGKVQAVGDGLSMVALGQPTSFTISAPGANMSDLKVLINGPSGRQVPYQIRPIGDDIFLVEYTPQEIGDHDVDIQYLGMSIPGAPFTPKTWDPRAVIVTNVNSGVVNKPYNFNIDASRAGAGNLEIIVSVAGENVPNFVKSQGKGRFDVSFTPKVPDTHMISVKFNGEPVSGSPFMVEMIDPGKIHQLERGHVRVPIGRPATVSIDPRRASAIAEQAIIEVIAPSDAVLKARVFPGRDGRLRGEFVPIEVGPHCINVTIGSVEIPGSPFACDVFDINKVKLAPLKRGVIGKAYEIEMDASKAGAGQLEVNVKSNNNKMPVKLIDKGGGLYRAYFLPRQVGRHMCFVNFSRETVPGSPFTFEVEDDTQVYAEGRCLEASPINQVSEFIIDPENAPFKANATVKILSPMPDRYPVPFNIAGNYLEGWVVSWIPRTLGVHSIEVRYGDRHIVGSPFRCRVYDLSKIKIIREESEPGVDMDGIPGEDIVFYVDASEGGAGNLEIIVRCAKDGHRIPNLLEAADRSGKFRIFFTPRPHCYRYKVDVTFNNDQVAGSPFFCALVDGSKATASGPGLGHVPANHLTYFDVTTGGLGDAELDVEVLSPGGFPVECNKEGSPERGYRVQYKPTEVGRHRINCQYADADIRESPFFPQVFDTSLVRVGDIPNGVPGKPVHFEVDCSLAGEGTLTVDVHGQTTSPQPYITSKGNGLFDVMFTPIEASPHTINVTFNTDPVPNSPFTCNMHDINSMNVKCLQVDSLPVHRPASLDLAIEGAPEHLFTVRITDPLGHEVPAQITLSGETHKLEFTPMEVGSHLITVLYNGTHVNGSPFTCHVFDAGKVKVTDITELGHTGQLMGFVVDTTLAGRGLVEAEVTHNSQIVPLTHTAESAFRHNYTFIPRTIGTYLANVMFNKDKLPDCPISMIVQDPSSKLSVKASGAHPINSLASSTISTHGMTLDLSKVTAMVTAPNGQMVPAKMVLQPDGDYKVEYSSRFTGRHMVEILWAGQPIMGSPFYVEIYDPNKIRVDGIKVGSVGERMTFDIIRHEAGKAELGLTIVSPSGKDMPYDITPTPLGERVTYIPHEAGPHHIYITYGGLEVPGCPMTQTVQESGSIRAFGDGLFKGEEDKPATFYVDTQGKRGDLFVQVDGPNSIAKCNIEPERSGRYVVTYVPVEVGLFNVQIKWNNREIEGSPFRPKIIDPRKIHVMGGWSTLLDAGDHMLLNIGETKSVKFDCSDAGPGTLSAEVKGPGGAIIPVDVYSEGRGIFVVSFVPRQHGEHYLSVKYAEMPLPRSPYYGVTRGSRAGPINIEKVVLTGRGLQEARVGEEAEFVIDGTDAGPGTPEVSLSGIKQDIPVQILELGQNKYRCVYVPQMPGGYLLTISWSGRQVRGSPFKVNVIALGNANKVVCSGEGLKMGIMGREIKSVIDTRKAGPGELTAQCRGPTKVAFCELFDHQDGTFMLNIKPQEVGKHILQIKYDGEHVPGSPYPLRISGAPDARKVKCYGPGIQDGVLHNFASHFIVETRGAGAGQLTVRVRGPKGAFRVEMRRESQKDRTIKCQYDPTEVGDYMIHVKWSGEHVPGSPFHVQVFDTNEELEHARHQKIFR